MKNIILVAGFLLGGMLLVEVDFSFAQGRMLALDGNADCIDPVLNLQVGDYCTDGLGRAGTCKPGPDGVKKVCIVNSQTSSTNSPAVSGYDPEGLGSYTGSSSASAKCGAGFEEKAGICFPTNSGLPDPSGGVIEILGSFLSWLFAIFSIFSVGAFVISGIQYLVSAGDTGIIDTAKRNMKWSVVGIIIGLSGFLILKAVISALSGSAIF